MGNKMTDQIENVIAEDVSLKQVADALEAKTVATDALIDSKVSTEALDQVKADSEAQIKSLNDKVEALEAKADRPALKTSSIKESNTMDNKDMLATFARKGVEGLRAKAADVQISVDAQGGFALPTEVASNIIQLQHESSPIRQLVGGISTSTTDYSQLVSIGGSASGWVGETAARPNTGSPELAKISAVFGEVYASPKAYQHVLEDSFFNVEAWLAGEVAREFSEQENSAFLNGNGTNKPVGILNGLDTTAAYIAGDATRAFGKYQVIKSGVATNLGATSDAVINLLRSVVLNTKTGYLGNAKWMMSRATHNVLVDLKTTDGEYFLQRDITVAAAGRIFGYEIVINEDMAEIGAGNMPIVFGDFAAGYQVVDRVGVSMLRDPYSAHGAISFYTRKRVGSMLLNTEALKVVAIAA
jgi:HK97 family phage major capsid protein|tara:strand:- start:1668 stop:2912 length:1245 start_codon:yes stop_codon:yes gene_type:complete